MNQRYNEYYKVLPLINLACQESKRRKSSQFLLKIKIDLQVFCFVVIYMLETKQTN